MDAVEKAYQECTWRNTSQTVDDWRRILQHGNEDEKFALFEYLFREDPRGWNLHALFNRQERQEFTKRLDRPYTKPHLERRRQVWRSNLLGETWHIPALEWRVRG